MAQPDRRSEPGPRGGAGRPVLPWVLGGCGLLLAIAAVAVLVILVLARQA